MSAGTPKPKMAMKMPGKPAPKVSDKAPSVAGAVVAGKGAPKTPAGAQLGTKTAPFVASWLRFVEEGLGEWLKADLSQILGATAGLEDKVKILVRELEDRFEDAESFRKFV